MFQRVHQLPQYGVDRVCCAIRYNEQTSCGGQWTPENEGIAAFGFRQRQKGFTMIERHASDDSKFYLVGAGIASLAAAAFLIRDGGIKGSNIEILEESSQLGGSLDAGGDPNQGYAMRGGRMLESKYLCTFDLFSSIPTLDGTQTVAEETVAWNKTMPTSSKSRLVRGGKSIEAPAFG